MLISIFASLRSSGSSNKQPSCVSVRMLIHTDVKKEEEANVKAEARERKITFSPIETSSS